VTRESPVCRIIVDLFEWRSGVPHALQANGVDVEMAQLRVGDYDLGKGVLVERKTVEDLHLSLERGRLWRQVGGLRRTARFPYLLVEGGDLDIGSLSPAAVRGACLAVVGQGVPVVRSENAQDSATWLRILAQRRLTTRLGRDRPVYAQRLKPTRELAAEAMLSSVPGISVVGARALLDRFGSVAGVVAADEREWRAVPGIGPSRASALREAIS
jgi:DNA excision repair protein ERCC-4